MISAVILAKNEENTIVDCIENLSFCDEVIVIDDNSDDKTTELAKRLKATVFSRAMAYDFSAQRNFGLEKASGDWILFVDADEWVTPELAKEIEEAVRLSSLENNGFYIKRKDYMWDKELKHGEVGSMKLLRLAKRDAGTWEGKVHERWRVKGPTGELEHPFLHYPHQSIKEFLEEINMYTDLRAQELYEKGIKAYWWSIILYPKMKFFINYFFKQGFRDGIPGLIFALLMSFHSFLVRGKLWYLWQQKKSS